MVKFSAVCGPLVDDPSYTLILRVINVSTARATVNESMCIPCKQHEMTLADNLYH